MTLAAALANARQTWAADDTVRLSCPELTTERAAELESRVRANLLTSELTATVRIACQPNGTEVRVASATDDVAVQVPLASVETFRDDVLRAVEEALAELSRRAQAPAAIDTNPAPASTEPLPTTSAAPTKTPPATAAPRAVAHPPAPASPPAASGRAATEIFAAALGEAWANRIAVGGSLGVARSTPFFWYGVRAAVLRPAAGSPDFSATECHAALEIAVQPGSTAGVRAGVGVGPSLLFVAPRGSLIAHNDKAKTALFVAPNLSRPFWFGRWAVLPSLGVRLFTGERGVRIDGEERLTLHRFAPFLSLGLAYRAD